MQMLMTLAPYGFGLLLLFGPRAAFAQATLSVTPAYAYITEEDPHGSFMLRNDGLAPVEVLVSARFGVIESDAEGASTHVSLGEGGLLGNLSERLTFFPTRLILEPGSERVVRYLVRDVEAMREGAHIALMHYQMQERGAVEAERAPEVATQLSIVYNLVAPIVLIHGHGAPRLRAKVLGADAGSLVLLLTNDTAFPFVGGVSVVSRRGRTMGRAESAVYTRRRLEISLSGDPPPGGLVLRFDGDYTGMPAAMRRRFVVPAPIEVAL